MRNTQLLVDQLNQLAFQTKSETYKSRAYSKAANSIQHLSDIELNERTEFNDLSGVGSSINEKIKTFMETGYLPGITSETVFATNMIKERVGFNTTRVPLWTILKLIDTKLAVIKDSVEFVGSIRREVAYIADIDVLAESDVYTNIVDYLKGEFRLLVEGDSKTSFIVDEENFIQLDINCMEKSEKAFAMLHHTGSANHNIKLRAIAKRNDWVLNQYGLFDLAGFSIFTCKTEGEIFNKLGVPYLEPKYRK